MKETLNDYGIVYLFLFSLINIDKDNLFDMILFDFVKTILQSNLTQISTSLNFRISFIIYKLSDLVKNCKTMIITNQIEYKLVYVMVSTF